MTQREIFGPLPEAPAGVGFPPAALKRRRGGPPLPHRTGKLKRQTLSQEEMIGRYISQVPAPHFKRVRYSGFLANRKRGALLPKVYSALKMTTRKNRISRNSRC